MSYLANMSAGGKIVVPAELRRELGIQPGDTLVIEREDGKLVLKSYLQVVREIQTEIKQLMKQPDTVDDFIPWKRAEAAGEDAA